MTRHTYDVSGRNEGSRGTGAAEGHAHAGSAKTRRKGMSGRTIGLLVLVLLVAAGAIGGTFYWLQTRNEETTDDAFIDGDVVQISPQVAGRVLHSHITDNQYVHAGDLLIEIDPSDFAAALASAQATLDAAVAQQESAMADLDMTRVTSGAGVDEASSGLAAARQAVAQAQAKVDGAHAESVRANADVARYQDLIEKHDVSKQKLDQAIADAKTADANLVGARKSLSMAEAQVGQALARLSDAHSAPQQVALKTAQLHMREANVEQARAALRTAEINLSYTKIYAPQSGWITKRAVQDGDVVDKNQDLAALVLDHPWVVANFKETQLTRMRAGQPVEISVDAYPGVDFRGHVDSIQAGTGARFSLLPPENATGNYVKVVQRVPVKIVFDTPPDPRHPLALGMSVVPTVDVGYRPKPAPRQSADATAPIPAPTPGPASARVEIGSAQIAPASAARAPVAQAPVARAPVAPAQIATQPADLPSIAPAAGGARP